MSMQPQCGTATESDSFVRSYAPIGSSARSATREFTRCCPMFLRLPLARLLSAAGSACPLPPGTICFQRWPGMRLWPTCVASARAHGVEDIEVNAEHGAWLDIRRMQALG